MDFLAQRKWRFPLLKRLAKRVDGLSDKCEECQSMKNQIEGLYQHLAHWQDIVRHEYKNYQAVLKCITLHLKQKHKLVNEKQYTKRLVSASFLLGLLLIVLGCVLLYFGNTLLALSITIPALFIRVIFSYTIGFLLDFRAEKQGRVI